MSDSFVLSDFRQENEYWKQINASLLWALRNEITI
jgi:hypothetical protein